MYIIRESVGRIICIEITRIEILSKDGGYERIESKLSDMKKN